MKNVDRVFVSKGWGWESWIVNNSKYCGKELHFARGRQCSWHYHKVKEETFLCIEGKVAVWYWDGDDFDNEDYKDHVPCLTLEQGDSMHIPVGRRHAMMGLQNSCLIEFSTQHFDEDSIRVVKGN